jgi:hypothetical protein
MNQLVPITAVSSLRKIYAQLANNHINLFAADVYTLIERME